MTATRWTTLLGLAVGVGALTFAGARWLVSRGGDIGGVGWLVLPVEVLIAAVVLAMGWQVRQFLRGRRPDLDPIRAARTAVLAKASCYTGALLTGWYLGQASHLVVDLSVPGNGGRAVQAGLATLGAVLLVAVGLLVERFCRIPPPTSKPPVAGGDTRPDPAAG